MKRRVKDLAVKYQGKNEDEVCVEYANDAWIRRTPEVHNGKQTGKTIVTIIYISEGDPRES